jgi:Zn-dependent M28 family amino/carboxypeptidase
VYDSQRTSFTNAVAQTGIQKDVRPSLPFTVAEINHELAAAILGITEEDVAAAFAKVREGKKLTARELPEVFVKMDVEVETYNASSRNVIAVVEGSDPVLKNEYVVISGHHDGRGIDDGEIIPAADDNGTATVALMEIGQALLAERPARSVILAWVTGEEQGMNGSHYFINNCPVPVEKITTCLNMDMLGRNHTDSLFLVGSDLLSSELDASIRKMNRKSGINFGFDYSYSNLTHPQRVYFRSDHYPFIRFGIPSVWFFCGFTPDYHTYRDITERIDYGKFLKATKLVYATAMDIGNMKNMLKLDVNPVVTSRGKHNIRESSLYQP